MLPYFDPSYRRLTTDDILFSNNSNVLVVDNETTELSERTHKFHVRCCYLVPVVLGDAISDEWREEIVAFSDLKVDISEQHAWLYDYEMQRKVCEDRVSGLFSNRRDELKWRILRFWRWYSENQPIQLDRNEEWLDIRKELSEIGVPPPSSTRQVESLMFAVLSVKDGSPVGWDFSKLIEVVHHICERYPEHVLAIGHCIRCFEREQLLAEQDKSGKWARRRVSLRTRIKEGDAVYNTDEDTLPLLEFLLPDVGQKLAENRKALPSIPVPTLA